MGCCGKFSENPPYASMAIFLKEWRVHRELSQEQLAERLETTSATISRWERGKANWKAEHLPELADALGCDIEDLFWNPSKPNYEAWRIFRGMSPEKQKQVLSVIKALDASTAA